MAKQHQPRKGGNGTRFLWSKYGWFMSKAACLSQLTRFPGFEMKDPKCMEAGCDFKDGAKGGECTGTPGVLSAGEIQKIIKDGAKTTFDSAAAVDIVTWDDNQWVSWDDKKTLKLKVDYANKRCLGGYVLFPLRLSVRPITSRCTIRHCNLNVSEDG